MVDFNAPANDEALSKAIETNITRGIEISIENGEWKICFTTKMSSWPAPIRPGTQMKLFGPPQESYLTFLPFAYGGTLPLDMGSTIDDTSNCMEPLRNDRKTKARSRLTTLGRSLSWLAREVQEDPTRISRWLGEDSLILRDAMISNALKVAPWWFADSRVDVSRGLSGVDHESIFAGSRIIVNEMLRTGVSFGDLVERTGLEPETIRQVTPLSKTSTLIAIGDALGLDDLKVFFTRII